MQFDLNLTLPQHLKHIFTITAFITLLFGYTAAQVSLVYINGIHPCQSGGANAPLKTLNTSNWPLQCDLACIRYGNSEECKSWTWNRISSECKLFKGDLTQNGCVENPDENVVFVKKSFVYAKDEFNAKV